MNQKKLNVLIADDSPFVVEMISRVVESLGHFTVKAKDGEKALEVAFHQVPDVIILDVKMPKKDGLAVLEELRKDPRFSKTPIIMLTGVRDADVVRRSVAAGATSYVLKTDPREIAERLSDHLPRVR